MIFSKIQLINVLSILFHLISSEKVLKNYALTWEILEEDLRERFSIPLQIGEQKSATMLGKGLMSKVFLVDFDWKNESNFLMNEKKVPSKCALKILSRQDIDDYFKTLQRKENSMSLSAFASSAHNQELFWYGNLTEMGLDGLKIPIFYSGRPFDSTTGWGYILMEYLGNAVVKKIYDHFEDSQIREVIEQLVYINILTYKKAFKNIVTSQLFPIQLKDSLSKQVSIMWLEKIEKQFPNKRKQFEKLIRVAESFENRSKLYEKLERNCPIKLVTHGDFWPPNLFWTINNEKQIHLKALADFQYTHFGNPLYELVKLLFYTTHAENALQKRNAFISYYFETLTALSANQSLPWASYDQFIKQFEIMYVWKTIENAHSMEIIRKEIFDQLQEPLRTNVINEYAKRYSVMLDEAERIFDQRTIDLL